MTMTKPILATIAFVLAFSVTQTYFVYDEPKITYTTVLIKSNGQMHEYEVIGVNVQVK
jgi:hypothetical protein